MNTKIIKGNSLKGIALLSITMFLVVSVFFTNAQKSFAEDISLPPSLTLTTSASAGGTVSPAGLTTYDITAVVPIADVTITATPNDGYRFDSWSGDLTGSTNPATITMDGNKTVTANFVAIDPSPTTNSATAITSTDATLNGANEDMDATGHSFWVSLSPIVTTSPNIPSGVYSTPDLGPISANTTFSALLSSITNEGIPTNLPTITPNTKYYFVAWSLVDGTWYPGQVLSFNTSADVVNVPPATPKNQYTLETITGVNGTINFADDTSCYSDCTYYYGASTPGMDVTITATPNDGYRFDSWSGDLTGSTNPATITMDGNKTVTANFVVNPVDSSPIITSGQRSGISSSGGHVLVNNTVPSISPVGQVLGAETFKFTEYMMLGLKDNEVKELQNRLKSEGYFKDTIDGIFGKNTQNAVEAYQFTHTSLKVDGIVGPKTRAVLNA